MIEQTRYNGKMIGEELTAANAAQLVDMIKNEWTIKDGYVMAEVPVTGVNKTDLGLRDYKNVSSLTNLGDGTIQINSMSISIDKENEMSMGLGKYNPNKEQSKMEQKMEQRIYQTNSDYEEFLLEEKLNDRTYTLEGNEIETYRRELMENKLQMFHEIENKPSSYWNEFKNEGEKKPTVKDYSGLSQSKVANKVDRGNSQNRGIEKILADRQKERELIDSYDKLDILVEDINGSYGTIQDTLKEIKQKLQDKQKVEETSTSEQKETNEDEGR